MIVKSKFISWMAVILWMGVIFLFSHQPATDSRELSSGITAFILTTVEKISPEISNHVDTLHHIVRKNAHFTIYMILGALTINALAKSRGRSFRSAVFSLIICVLYAASDEMHQLWIPGRSGEVRDVFIDSCGASAGILVYLAAGKLFAGKKRNKSWKEIAQHN